MSTIAEIFKDQPVMAILRNMPIDKTLELAHRAWDLGIDLVEVPIQAPDAIPALEAVCSAGRERGKEVGSGTVVTVEQLQASQAAGATFTVAPGTDESVIRESQRLGIPHLPGVATATEIQNASLLGISWVKVFPALNLGASWFRTMAGPFPNMSFVATGGMNAHNCEEFLNAGVKTVAVGSALADPEQVDLLAKSLSFDRN